MQNIIGNKTKWDVISLIIMIAILVYVCLFTGCTTTGRTNSIELDGWVKITFKDELELKGKKVNGYYYAVKREGKPTYHYIRIARDTPDMEKTLTVEFLHALGYRHETEDEKKVFDKKMVEHGY